MVHLDGENPLMAAALAAAEAPHGPRLAGPARREQTGNDIRTLDATIDSLRSARLAKAAPRERRQRPTRAL